MASIFTYDNASRVSSPWSTPGSSTPQPSANLDLRRRVSGQGTTDLQNSPVFLDDLSISRLEPEQHGGPVEYKLHLLLRPRRKFSFMSTTTSVPSSQYFYSVGPDVASSIGTSLAQPTHAPSTQTRQARLQQLTTQLLWRLQQSSPFHSSSNADLVLPVLPEAMPNLGVPDRPAKLLPGLEESQGALYEIGVADDGTLIGLVEEELDESLNNLKAMAASLGCVVDVQRRVLVGNCRWSEASSRENAAAVHNSQLWVAEALVRPDLECSGNLNLHLGSLSGILDPYEAERSDTEQLRIALIGSSGTGKSSLLGTLTTSIFDNGRGKSRLSLLKHRHEIASGITSSVAQELLGYSKDHQSDKFANVINYNTEDVSSWSDIHNRSHRLVFISDSPGLSRYSKSFYRALISWSPHWTLVCVAADEIGEAATLLQGRSSLGQDEISSSPLQHLHLCLKLGVPLVVVVTKLDVATRSGLRSTLSELLSVLKRAAKKPILLNSTPAPASELHEPTGNPFQDVRIQDVQEAIRVFQEARSEISSIVPVLLTSSVNGTGLQKLHALLYSLPCSAIHFSSKAESKHQYPVEPFERRPTFLIDEVFMIPPSKVYSASNQVSGNNGIVLCGYLLEGKIAVSDQLVLGPINPEHPPASHTPGSLTRRQLSLTIPDEQGVESAVSINSSRQGYEEAQLQDRSHFIPVRVVSLRNLRLPVRSLLRDQAGTVGIVPIDPNVPLHKARKGLILTNPSLEILGYRGFTASFSYVDFASDASPPLILGGHAIVYVNNVRAAVKVVTVALEDNENSDGQPASSSPKVFNFESESDEDDATARNGFVAGQAFEHPEPRELRRDKAKNIHITFRFVSSIEWMRTGDRVLVVPTATAAGPITGSSAALTNSGLNGFVGIVSELHT